MGFQMLEGDEIVLAYKQLKQGDLYYALKCTLILSLVKMNLYEGGKGDLKMSHFSPCVESSNCVHGNPVTDSGTPFISFRSRRETQGPVHRFVS